MNNNLGVAKFNKQYVEVIARHTIDGDTIPLKIITDQGETFTIDKIKHKCRSASILVGGCGIRYTIRIKNTITFLYDEENGYWFRETQKM